MDFFAAQELRRKKTRWMIVMYVLAIIAIIIGIYVVVVIALGFSDADPRTIFNPLVFVAVAALNIAIIGFSSLYKVVELRSGGQQIASMLGGTRIPASTTDFQERRLLNVVEEMALASGISVPPVYLLENEPGINAFAAGYSPADAVIGVNRGTIESLNRDELQGVIAHEFSHILNGDMRLNIRLIGLLFGIQTLAMIGYFLLRSMGGSHRRSSNRDGNKGAGAILAIALAFLVFGSIGQFFARLIKANISRQREYLADASAVQFTRYPDGIGGALKMIGVNAQGSHIESAEAEQLSHMFFASCFKSNQVSWFATHPPLTGRIQKIDPDFDGDYTGYLKVRERIAAAREKRRQAKEQRDSRRLESPLGKLFPASISERFSIDPAFLLAAIGAPDIDDVSRSKALLKELPDQLVESAHHPYSARCIAFAMLASSNQPQWEQQLELLRSREGQPTVETTQQLVVMIRDLPLAQRLPLMEMIQGSLADLSPQQYRHFRGTVEQQVNLDNKTSLFEFVVRHHLLMHLDRRFEVQPPPRVRFFKTAAVAREIELLLSAFASASVTGSVLENSSEPDPEQVLASYRLAMQVAGFGDAAQSDAQLQDWEVSQLEKAMGFLHRCSPGVKKQFLQSAAVLITYDHEITVAEAEFFRAVAESLDCPVPLFAAGRAKPVAPESAKTNSDK